MRRLLIAVLVALVATPSVARPARPAVRSSPVYLELDHSKAVRLRGAASGVVVGDASIADVIVHNPQVLIIMGKSIGHTNVLVVDNDGKTLYQNEVYVSPGSSAGMVTTMRGKEIQTSLCTSRCVDVPSPESTNSPMNDAIGRIRARQNNTGGNSRH